MLSAVGGDVPYRNEKSANLATCLRVGFVLFRSLAIRGAVSPGHKGCDTPGSQKARSAIRCIKTGRGFLAFVGELRRVRKHGAP